METDQVWKDIVVQGTLLDYNTEVYASILQRMRNSREFTDPFAKLVASTFNMCREGAIDPWNIDLKSFSRIFMEIIDENFDKFGMAGYLIGQAWGILLEKTEVSVMRRQKREESGPLDQEISAEDMDLTVHAEEDHARLDLAEPVKHKEKRPVMLVELLEAMRYAYRKDRVRHRPKPDKEELDLSAMEEIIFELHGEEPEKEIDETYSRILSQLSDTFYMEELWGQSIEDRWSFLVYCLFLMREKMIIMRQEEEFGKILVERVSGSPRQLIDIKDF